MFTVVDACTIDNTPEMHLLLGVLNYSFEFKEDPDERILILLNVPMCVTTRLTLEYSSPYGLVPYLTLDEFIHIKDMKSKDRYLWFLNTYPDRVTKADNIREGRFSNVLCGP